MIFSIILLCLDSLIIIRRVMGASSASKGSTGITLNKDEVIEVKKIIEILLLNLVTMKNCSE